VSTGPNGVRAAWVIQDQRPGSTAWKITGRLPGTIAGFGNRTYAAAGDTITLYVSTNASDLHVEAKDRVLLHSSAPRAKMKSYITVPR
jgi:hypothetical protein